MEKETNSATQKEILETKNPDILIEEEQQPVQQETETDMADAPEEPEPVAGKRGIHGSSSRGTGNCPAGNRGRHS